MPTVAVGIRFAREDWARHSAAAQARGVPLGVYLRQLIDEHERGSSALAEIRALLERRSGAADGSAGPAAIQAALLEALLILRQNAGPQRVGVAQKEVERRGLEPW